MKGLTERPTQTRFVGHVNALRIFHVLHAQPERRIWSGSTCSRRSSVQQKEGATGKVLVHYFPDVLMFFFFDSGKKYFGERFMEMSALTIAAIVIGSIVSFGALPTPQPVQIALTTTVVGVQSQYLGGIGIEDVRRCCTPLSLSLALPCFFSVVFRKLLLTGRTIGCRLCCVPISPQANHQLYGGLYAQMVFGESFEEPAGSDGVSGSEPWVVSAYPGCFGTSQGPTWHRVRGSPSVAAGPAAAFRGNQSQRLQVGDAVANTGLLGAGMAFAANHEYHGSIYVRSSGVPATATASSANAATDAASKSVRLVLTAMVGKVAAATFAVEVLGGRSESGSWQRVNFTLTPNISSSCNLGPTSPSHTGTCNSLTTLTGCTDGCVSSPELGQRCKICTGSLMIAVEEPSAVQGHGAQSLDGTASSAGLDVDQVMLQPGAWGKYKGTLPVRKDLGELMEHSNPGGMMLSSLRLGGSMVLCPGYRWKSFRGRRELRSPYAGVWYKFDSPGWKMFEMLDFCEAAGIPACVVTLPVTETVDDLVDLMEYSFGGNDTVYGALRIKDGRAKPYQPYMIEIGNENPMNITGKNYPPGLSPAICRDSCHNFTGLWIDRATAMDAKAQQLGVTDLAFIVGFDAAAGTTCSAASVQSAASSIVDLAKKAASLGRRAVWDCHTGGDIAADGNVTAAALASLQTILKNAHSLMRAAVLEENGMTHTMTRMLGHITQTHALARLGDFVAVNTVATGLQPLGRNSNGYDQGNIFFTPEESWLSPPAVATQMSARSTRDLMNVLQLKTADADGSFSEDETFPAGLDIIATCSDDKQQLSIRVANPYNTNVPTILTFPVDSWTISKLAVEALAAPSPDAVRAAPVRSTVNVSASGRLEWTFTPYSYTTFTTK